MADITDNEFIRRLKAFLKPGTKPGTEETEMRFIRREKVVVFVGAYIMAISLWFIVNLSGSFNITINIPVEPGNVPENMALTEDLPEFVQVSVSGDGWQLLNLYNDPPTVVINIEESEINLFDQVRQRLSYLQEIDVAKVQPLLLSVNMEPKISKRVPVKINTDLNFQPRFGLVGEPTYSPDSITVTGAQSRIEDITEWEVQDTLRLEGIREDISVTLPLEDAIGVVELSENEITYNADVSEFTEGETTVYIRTRGLPRGQNVNYNPSSVTIRFDVPIEQYAEVEKIRPYEVYVPYAKILEDSTGFVTPDIEQTAEQFELRLRSFQPKAVAYFTVLN
ncbi:MAG: YbbR-like domain-containing protein [Gracilimonas sp.]|uniref:CdaR family protein n=1 Tax=Gracilimonas TaxID=649462 RepID=UPI001B0E2329|nr:YbbR-like domain-containing protein [Gracilimonas sp.]MBO6584479.1 YbbR-like domain-containing protein [Gracilimonas sp.]MBO6616250.1 YbbR-like domain-containing protein [Gracilimonas sp.]